MTLTEIIHAHRRPNETMTQCSARLRKEASIAPTVIVEEVVEEKPVKKKKKGRPAKKDA